MNNRQFDLRKIGVVLIIMGVLLISITAWFSYRNNMRDLELTFTEAASNTTSVMYALSEKNERLHPKELSNKNQKLRLKKGSYVITTKGADYDEMNTSIDLKEESKAVTISPKFTQEKLAKLLEAEKEAIYSAIREQVPRLNTEFVVEPGRLYETGEWYGTTIRPNISVEQLQSTYYDSYRLVAKKDNDRWVIVTTPPEIVVSHIKYPTIPRDVLVELNKNPSNKN